MSSLATGRRLWLPQTGIFLAVWLLLLLGGRDRLFRDPGTFWHTRLGQIMIAERGPIHGDPFSFTGREHSSWVPTQWLGECLMAILYRLGGWDVLQLAAVTILAALYTWIAHRLLVAGLHWALAAALLMLCIGAGSSHFHIRPHLATMVFFALTSAFLIDFDAGRIGIRRLWWLLPMYLLWTNLHGGMLGGLVTMALALAGWIALRGIGWPSPLRKWQQIVPLGLLLFACALTALVNPYGWRLPAEWLNIMGQKRLNEVLQEHAPLDTSRPEGIVVICFGAVYVLVLVAVCVRRRPRITWLLPLVWFYLSWTHVRHASLFGIAAALTLADMLPETAWAERAVRRGSDLFDAARGRLARASGLRPFLLPAVLVAAAFVLKANGIAAPVVGAGWARLDPDICPLEQAEFLRERPDGTRVFNELNFGGCLICFAPNVRVFADDRAELYGERFLLDYDRAARDPERTEMFLHRYDYRFALTRNDSAFDAYFRRPDSGWVVVKTTGAATLYRCEEQAMSRRLLMVTAAGCVMALLIGLRPISDVDLFWQVRLGQLICEGGGLGGADPFTFTHASEPFPPVCWLTQVVYAALFDLGHSLRLLQIVDNLLFVGALLVAGLSVRATQARASAVVGAMVLGFLAALPHNSVRPQTFAVFCFALFFALYNSRRSPWVKVVIGGLILVIWQNLHPSVVVAGIALAPLLAAEIVAFRSAKGRPFAERKATLRTTVALLLVLCVAQFTTPLGFNILSVSSRNAWLSLHLPQPCAEWLPCWDARVAPMALASLGLPMVITLLLLIRVRFRLPAADLLLLGVMTILAVSAIRFGFFMAIALVPVWARLLERALPTTPLSETATGRRLILPACVAILLAAALPVLLRPQLFAADVPSAAVEQLRANLPAGRLYNFQPYGGPLVWERDCRWQVLMDGRIYVFSDSEWSEYYEAAAGRVPVDDLAERYAADAFVLHPFVQAGLIHNLREHPRWREIHADESCCVFVRN